jgi:hypothetical protein
MRSAVCARLVVAPPISSGKVIPARSISAATVTISSSDGVMRPDRPIIAASCSRAVSRILVQGTITPRSMTSKPLHWRTTPTMFLPNVVDVALDGGHDHPAFRRVHAGSLFGFDEGQQWRPAFFMTRADFTTCGRNILPDPNRSPTTFMPSISGPSMTSMGVRRGCALSVSSTMSRRCP